MNIIISQILDGICLELNLEPSGNPTVQDLKILIAIELYEKKFTSNIKSINDIQLLRMSEPLVDTTPLGNIPNIKEFGFIDLKLKNESEDIAQTPAKQ